MMSACMMSLVKATALPLVTFAITLAMSSSAHAGAGKYVCSATCATTAGGSHCVANADPADVARTLNKLKCDTDKPFTVSPAPAESVLTMICCVQR